MILKRKKKDLDVIPLGCVSAEYYNHVQQAKGRLNQENVNLTNERGALFNTIEHLQRELDPYITRPTLLDQGAPSGPQITINRLQDNLVSIQGKLYKLQEEYNKLEDAHMNISQVYNELLSAKGCLEKKLKKSDNMEPYLQEVQKDRDRLQKEVERLRLLLQERQLEQRHSYRVSNANEIKRLLDKLNRLQTNHETLRMAKEHLEKEVKKLLNEGDAKPANGIETRIISRTELMVVLEEYYKVSEVKIGEVHVSAPTHSICTNHISACSSRLINIKIEYREKGIKRNE